MERVSLPHTQLGQMEVYNMVHQVELTSKLLSVHNTGHIFRKCEHFPHLNLKELIQEGSDHSCSKKKKKNCLKSKSYTCDVSVSLHCGGSHFAVYHCVKPTHCTP